MSFPTSRDSRDRRERPEVNVAHVRPMVIKEPVSMASQWPLSSSSGHLSRMGNHVAPSLTATGLASSSFPFMPRDVSSFQQASLMNALPPFHLLPGNDVFHAGLPSSYSHYATSLNREELLHRDVIGPSASPTLLHSQSPPFVLNNSLLHHFPFRPVAYPYGFIKENTDLEPYRPLVLSKPNTPERPSKLENLAMTQANDSFALHSHSPQAKRKCHIHEKIWDHKTPPDKKEASVSQISKQSLSRDSKCVLRVPEIKPQQPPTQHRPTFMHTKPHQESNRPAHAAPPQTAPAHAAGEVLDLSLKRRRSSYDEKDIPPVKKATGPERIVETAPTKVNHVDTSRKLDRLSSSGLNERVNSRPNLFNDRMDSRLGMMFESQIDYRLDSRLDIWGDSRPNDLVDKRMDKRMDKRLDYRLDRMDGRFDVRQKNKHNNRLEGRLDIRETTKQHNHRLDSRLTAKQHMNSSDRMGNNRVDGKLQNILENQFESKLDTKVDSRPNSKPHKRFDNMMESRLENIVGAHLGARLENRLNDPFDSRLDKGLDKGLESRQNSRPVSRLDSRLDISLDCKRDSKLDSRPDSRLDIRLDSSHDDRIDFRLDSRVDNKLDKHINNELDCKVNDKTDSSFACRMDSVIRMAPRHDKGRRDGGFNTDNCRLSHAVPINNAAHKHPTHENHLDKANQQVPLTNNTAVSSKLDYEQIDKRRRRKQNKPQYHKQEDELAATDICASTDSSNDGKTSPPHPVTMPKPNEDGNSKQLSPAKGHPESHSETHKNKKPVIEPLDVRSKMPNEVAEVKSTEILRGDCHQVLLAQHVLNQVSKIGNVNICENVTDLSETETVVQLKNETQNVQLNYETENVQPLKPPKKKRGPAKKKEVKEKSEKEVKVKVKVMKFKREKKQVKERVKKEKKVITVKNVEEKQAIVVEKIEPPEKQDTDLSEKEKIAEVRQEPLKNETENVQPPIPLKKKRGPKKKEKTEKAVKSPEMKEILDKSQNGLQQNSDGPKKRGRKPKPKTEQGQKQQRRKKEKPAKVEKAMKENTEEESSCNKSAVEQEAANCQPLKQVTNERAAPALEVNETCTKEQCTEPLQPPQLPQPPLQPPLQPPKRKRGRPRKAESLARSNAAQAAQAAQSAQSIVKANASAINEQKTQNGQRAKKKVQTQQQEVTTSRFKPRKPSEINGKPRRLRGPRRRLKRCSVLLCKVQMDGRPSIKVDDLTSVSHCEANKYIIKSNSLALSAEKTKSLEGNRSVVDTSHGGGEIRVTGFGPGRRKKRSCGYPYSPLLFAIGHCPLPHCVACKGHTNAKHPGKHIVKKRKKISKQAEGKQGEGEMQPSAEIKVIAESCQDNVVKDDQFGCKVDYESAVIAASALNMAYIKRIDRSPIEHSSYHPDPLENLTQITAQYSAPYSSPYSAPNSGHSTYHKDFTNNNNILSQPFTNIPESNQQMCSFQENNVNVLSQKIGFNEPAAEEADNNSVSSDQTVLCVDEEVDVEGIGNLSPAHCEEAANVDSSVDSSPQENQFLVNSSFSDEQEGQAVPQETSEVHRDGGVRLDQALVNKQDSKCFAQQGSHYNAIQYNLDSGSVEKYHSNVHSDHTGDINLGYDMNIWHERGDGCSVQTGNGTLRLDSHLLTGEQRTLKGENYDAQEATFLEGDRQIVAYKGIVTLDESESAEMYPSGVYVSSVV